jgi:hypothetical protein
MTDITQDVESAVVGWKGYAAVLAIGLIVGVIVGGVIVNWKDGSTIANLNTRIATIQGNADAAGVAADTKYRALEQSQQKAVEDERAKSQQQQAVNSKAAADASAQLDSLRKQLASAAHAGGGQAAQPASPGSLVDGSTDGAAVLRYVVGECASRYVSVAAEADRLSEQVTALQGYVKAVNLPQGE